MMNGLYSLQDEDWGSGQSEHGHALLVLGHSCPLCLRVPIHRPGKWRIGGLATAAKEAAASAVLSQAARYSRSD
jgi:hypothetical protein